MSQSSPLREWLLQVPLLPGSLETRLAVRSQHIGEAMPKVKEGIITFAGGILSKPTVDGDNKDMTIVLFTVKAETEEKARKIMEDDIYTTAGVWDTKKAQISPWKTGIRVPL
ncbi:hypothetical protein EDB81DRAFT_638675 [Dactylonectria macrodidyma]|uniref:YCII-related domain-containing protein n=1 Tax=Dactylonectria macrodidyma TaxID=307937 RepID=A0A9P9FQ09_9HYPO|nr:hypothetical protein EDB81DRAFT_638675 [Dactylonectria macrodidyma]